jgi:hypothetical protein
MVLFAPRVTMPQTGAEPRTRIVCGMVILEADPKNDPKTIVEPPQDIAFTIRVHPRPGCSGPN